METIEKYPDFKSKMEDLKNRLTKISEESVSLLIHTTNIFMEINYPDGFSMEFDELDNMDFLQAEVEGYEGGFETYNEECYEHLYIKSNSPSDIETFYIPIDENVSFAENVEDVEFDEDFDHEFIKEIIEDCGGAMFIINSLDANYVFLSEE